MLGRWRHRVGGLCVLAGIALVGVGAFGPSVQAANLTLSGWTPQGGAADWQVQPSGDTVKVNAPNPDNPQRNGSPSFFVSPFNAAGTFKVNITPDTEADNDYVGFALGYTKPINDSSCQSAATCDTGFYLFDWKRSQEQENGTDTTDGHEGFSLMHVQGQHDLKNNDTTAHIACFWTHQNAANACDVLGTSYDLGKGYAVGISYTFQVTYSASQLKIVLLGSGGNPDTTIFEVAPASGTFPAGRVAFYNYSQPNVTYGFDAGTTPATTTTTLASTSTTAAVAPSTTKATVGPAVGASIVRTGPNNRTTTIELATGFLLLVAGALMTGARGHRPDGRYYA